MLPFFIIPNARAGAMRMSNSVQSSGCQQLYNFLPPGTENKQWNVLQWWSCWLHEHGQVAADRSIVRQ